MTTAAIVVVVSDARAQPQLDRPTRIDGRPDFNGVWQTLNTAHWSLESHSAEGVDEAWQLGAIAAIPRRAQRRSRRNDPLPS